MTMLPSLYLSTWFPQSIFRLRREGEEEKKKKRSESRDAFLEPAQADNATETCQRETGKESSNNAIVAILVGIVTTTNHTSDKAFPCFLVTVCQRKRRIMATLFLEQSTICDLHNDF